MTEARADGIPAQAAVQREAASRQDSMRWLGRSGIMAALLFAAYALAPQAPRDGRQGRQEQAYLTSVALAEVPAAAIESRPVPGSRTPAATDAVEIPSTGKNRAFPGSGARNHQKAQGHKKPAAGLKQKL